MTTPPTAGRLPRFLLRQWFLAALAVLLTLGMTAPAALSPLAAAVPRDLLIATIMLLMSLPIDLMRSLGGRGALRGVVIASAINALAAPLLAWLVSPLLPAPLAVGLVVASLVPCTIASAAVWTRRGGGNDAIAVAVTVVTNLACFLVLPAGAALLIGSRFEADFSAMAVRLLTIVVAPLAVGQLLRRPAACSAWCTRHKPSLGVVAQLGLLVMVFVGSVRAGEALAAVGDDGSRAFGLAEGSAMLAAVAAIHLALFALGWGSSRAAGLARADTLAVAVAGSQKTLAVGLDVSLSLGTLGLGAAGGLVVLPMIAYHAAQLLIDAVLVDRLGPHKKGPDHTGGGGPPG
ncbi:Sodium Bile acid symporter family protein [Pseudobythopirellula maris]|uniref:Sodium Bile acid symporter family protein n=1 Tax=Pseudobythopirellula maris TaxID=2527991 RepID=A0A5C5ZFQ5_9BACT|nr:bile acid:sodium symporter [Pseudobythopirellula maris]TWT86152.1 Sodium Bile acid symporter family protein [Pseudobythopirellula maris]